MARPLQPLDFGFSISALTAFSKLVVLSACETALGPSGMEYATISRAFAHAGVPSLIATLWRVNDEGSRLLEKKDPEQFSASQKALGKMLGKEIGVGAGMKDCPEPEEMALLLEGAVKKERRAKLLNHISECRICSEVFAQAAKNELFLKSNEAGHKVIPFKKYSATVRAILAVAAVSLFVFGLQLWRATYEQSQPENAVASLFQTSDLSRMNSVISSALSLPRGETVEDWVALQFGVRVVDLEVAVRVQDQSKARRLVESIEQLINSLEYAAGLLQDYSKLQSVDHPATIRELSHVKGRTETVMKASKNWQCFQSGRILESGRLASTVKNEGYLRSKGLCIGVE